MADHRGTVVTGVRVWADRWFLVLVAVGAVLAVGGGVLTAQGYLGPDTTTETRQTTNWESVGSFEHRATVVEDAGPFDAGTVLTNRSVYFREASPVLDGAFEYSYEASDGGRLETTARLVVVTESVERADDTETVLWRDETVLATRTASLAPDEALRVPFSWNVTAARRAAANVSEELGTTGDETTLSLEARVEVAGTRNDRTIDADRTYRLPVTVEAGLYRVDDPGAVTNGDTRTERVTVPASSGPVERVGGPLAVAVGTVGTIGVLLARHQGRLSPDADRRRWRAYRSTRQEFDEWITTVESVGDVSCDERVRVASLDGLVDLAIDTDARVVEDADTGRCLVARGDRCFVYEPPPRPTTDTAAEGTTDTATASQSLTGDGSQATATDGDETNGERGALGTDDPGRSDDGVAADDSG